MSFTMPVLRKKADQKPLAAAAPPQTFFANPYANMDPLDRPIRTAINPRAANTLCLARDALQFPLLRSFNPATGQQQPLDDPFKSVLATILNETAGSDPGSREPGGHPNRLAMLDTPIRIFNAMTKPQQLAFLDRLWVRCYEEKPRAVLARQMLDSETVASERDPVPMPTCLRPRDRREADVTFVAGPTQHAWTRYQIGFRIEGGKGHGDRDDLPRIRDAGLIALISNNPLAIRIAGKSYAGLDIASRHPTYMGHQNVDAYNESAVCVSRTLYGATGFPFRDSCDATDSMAYRYLLALDCNAMRGVDTEAEQLRISPQKLWRPGEKAFAAISNIRVLAWTAVKRDAPWTFSFVTATWTWLNKPRDAAKVQYLEDELAAWEPGFAYRIKPAYDFASGI